MSKNIKAVIVDDERLARNVLRNALSDFSNIIIAGEANNVSSAITIIKKVKPNVIFLDIQMPGESGFDLLEKIDTNFHIIFVTAYDKYAIRAFEVNALDYILKPVKKSRLKNAIDRLIANTKQETPIIETDYNDKLLLNVSGRMKLIAINKIVKVCADKDYSLVTTGDNKEYRILKSLKEWEEKLPAKYFLRVHRSTIINLELVEKIEKTANLNYKIILKNIPLPVLMSRRYAPQLKLNFKF